MEKENKTQTQSVKELEERFKNLNTYLGQNGEIVMDLVMRVASLERLLIRKNLLTEEEIQTEVSAAFAEIVAKAADQMKDEI